MPDVLPVPREEFVEPGLRIDIVELGSADKRVYIAAARPLPRLESAEQPGPSSEARWPEGPLGGVVGGPGQLPSSPYLGSRSLNT